MKDDSPRTPLDQMMADARADMCVAQAREAALLEAKTFCATLQGLGFEVEVIEESQLDRDLLTIRFDPYTITRSGLAGSTPELIGVDLARGPDAAVRVEVNEIVPKPELAREMVAPDPVEDPQAGAPEYVTGPFSDDELMTLIDMSAEGKSTDEIATHLGRTRQSVGTRLHHARAKVAARKAKRAAKPAPEHTPPPEGETPTPNDMLSADERAIEAHLNALGHAGPWDAEKDLALARSLARGDGLSRASEAIEGASRDDCATRWAALNTDKTSIDHQARLLRVLKLRATAS